MKEPLTRERALELHRQMWGDMQSRLGDNPSPMERGMFKDQWIKEHFPEERVYGDCFLCDYAFNENRKNPVEGGYCKYCPINWNPRRPENGSAPCAPGVFLTMQHHDYTDYRLSPISKILVLPKREVPDDKLS